MAFAVQNKIETKSEARKPTVWGWTFPLASLIGALYVWFGVILVHHLLPELWNEMLAWMFEGNMFLAGALKLTMLALATAGLIYAWPKVFPRMDGLPGGVVLLCAGWFLAGLVWWLSGKLLEWLLAWWQLDEIGQYVGLGLLTVLAVAEVVWLYRWAGSPRFRDWSLAIEEQGWVSLRLYKKGQGIWLRRGTMIGIILVLAAGVWYYTRFHLGGSGEWIVGLPFTGLAVSFVRMPRLTISLLVLGLGGWLAWRLVNYPRFADFLVSAENEMVKVYWPSWRSLWRDMAVVLVTMVLLAIFLYLMDILWTLVLGRFLGVLGG